MQWKFKERKGQRKEKYYYLPYDGAFCRLSITLGELKLKEFKWLTQGCVASMWRARIQIQIGLTVNLVLFLLHDIFSLLVITAHKA